VAGGWRRLGNEELHNIYAPPNIIMLIKSRRMCCAVHVARMGEMRSAYAMFIGKLKGEEHWGDLGVDGRILESILGK
jgi:hypothetical protein